MAQASEEPQLSALVGTNEKLFTLFAVEIRTAPQTYCKYR